MAVVVVTYSLRDRANTEPGLRDVINEFPNIDLNENCLLMATGEADLSAHYIYSKLSPHIEASDTLSVFTVTWDYDIKQDDAVVAWLDRYRH